MYHCYSNDFASDFWQCGQLMREAIFGFPIHENLFSIIIDLIFILVLTIIIKSILVNGCFSYLFQGNYNDPDLPSKDVLAKIIEYKQIRYRIVGYTALITIIAYSLKWTILRLFISTDLYPYFASILVIFIETTYLSIKFGKYLRWYSWLMLIFGLYLLILLLSFLPNIGFWRNYSIGGRYVLSII